MRTMPYLIKNTVGTWCVQRKVPDHLQAAVARVLGSAKPRQAYVKKSLATKDRREANHRAKHALADIDRVLREAAAIAERPKAAPAERTQLNDTEIKRMAEYVFAKALTWDERIRVGGRDELKRMEAEHLRLEGEEMGPWAYPYETLPPNGLSAAQLNENREQLVDDLRVMRDALALGDVSAVQDHIMEALDVFGINLAPGSLSYPKLGIAVLRAYVRALQAIEKRNAGEPVETPKFALSAVDAATEGATLRKAIEGWQKERQRPSGTVQEYRRAIEMHVQLHGDLPLVEIKRSHALRFREAIQEVPQRRTGPLRTASLRELAEHGRKNPSVPRVSVGTVNKQLGALQAIAQWAYEHGLLPEDAPWSNPFASMRLQEEQSERTSFEIPELQLLFAAPVFTKHEYPQGARGPAAFWLPLLALFTGARQAELAGLTVENVQSDEETSTPLLYITSQVSRGKRLKTASSQRVIAVHPQLVKLGFLRFVDDVRRREGATAWLFPMVAPDKGRSGVGAWSKWFGRYLRRQGVTDTAKVFHSFRHSVTDALRRGKVDHELREALVGHSLGSKVDYGAKQMLSRWGAAALRDAVAKISYPGLDLSRVRAVGTRRSAAVVKLKQK